MISVFPLTSCFGSEENNAEDTGNDKFVTSFLVQFTGV